jgi:murein DD-endopeptidase MepM/ murein hydrolase activator NlpD
MFCRVTRASKLAVISFQLLTAQLFLGLFYNPQPAHSQSTTACPAALERMRRHSVTSGETLAAVAAAYRLSTTTLSRFNPGVGNSPSAGTSLEIPPFNGSVVSVGSGETWQSLARRYGSRADVLFEVNGCVSEVPREIFVPSAPGAETVASAPTPVAALGYPLANPSILARSYGWQPNATQEELVFNSGVAFTINAANEVVASAGGTVAFTGDRDGYNNLVVVNHAQGLQTRYANLSNISVAVGQSVEASTVLGDIGSSDAPTFLYFEVRTNSSSGWVAQDPAKYVADLELR